MPLGPSGALPPLGGGSSRPAGVPVGHAAPPRQELEPIPLGDLGPDPAAAGSPRPTAQETAPPAPAASQADERKYKRAPVLTGKGAVRCKTFHTKLNDAALVYMDEMVNTWLEQHGYEAKFSQMTIGTFQGKSMEQHLIVQVWY